MSAETLQKPPISNPNEDPWAHGPDPPDEMTQTGGEGSITQAAPSDDPFETQPLDGLGGDSEQSKVLEPAVDTKTDPFDDPFGDDFEEFDNPPEQQVKQKPRMRHMGKKVIGKLFSDSSQQEKGTDVDRLITDDDREAKKIVERGRLDIEEAGKKVFDNLYGNSFDRITTFLREKGKDDLAEDAERSAERLTRDIVESIDPVMEKPFHLGHDSYFEEGFDGSLKSSAVEVPNANSLKLEVRDAHVEQNGLATDLDKLTRAVMGQGPHGRENTVVLDVTQDKERSQAAIPFTERNVGSDSLDMTFTLLGGDRGFGAGFLPDRETAEAMRERGKDVETDENGQVTAITTKTPAGVTVVERWNYTKTDSLGRSYEDEPTSDTSRANTPVVVHSVEFYRSSQE